MGKVVRATLDEQLAVSATLSDNPIYFDAAIDLATLKFYKAAPRLRQLYCSSCAFTGMYFGVHVFNAPPAEPLVIDTIDLSGNNFTGGTLFAPNSAKLLDLGGNPNMRAEAGDLVSCPTSHNVTWLAAPLATTRHGWLLVNTTCEQNWPAVTG